MILTSRKRIITRAGIPAFLDGLAESPGGEALTFYLPPRIPAGEIDNLLKEIPETPDVLAELSKIAGNSRTGAAIFWSREKTAAVLPPFPITGERLSRSLDTESLLTLLLRDRLIALVLVRLGSYAVGVCEGEKLVRSKVGTGLIHGRHRKGGSSAHRFERHRDKQIESFLTRVCGRSREKIEPYVKSLDYLVYGGARTTVQLLQKQCDFIGKLETPALPPLYDIPEPNQVVLEDAIIRVWSSTVYEWQED